MGAFTPYWLDLPGESRATIAKITRPELSESSIASLAGVTPRTLRRWEQFKRARPAPADFKHIRRQPTKRRASNTGGWWALDNPDQDSAAE